MKLQLGILSPTSGHAVCRPQQNRHSEPKARFPTKDDTLDGMLDSQIFVQSICLEFRPGLPCPHSCVFAFGEIHFGGGEGQGFPVEAAFEKEGAASVFCALEALLELVFVALELFRTEGAFAGSIIDV
jgi:hypothetical protein